jgi:hypothetical protein
VLTLAASTTAASALYQLKRRIDMSISARGISLVFLVLAVSCGIASAQFNGIGWNNGIESNYGILHCYGDVNCLTVSCSASGGGTLRNMDENGGFTMFGITVPWFITPGTFSVGCTDGSQGTLTVYETWPLINSDGVVNDTYGGNTLTVGTSGYLSIYGIGLTAGGKTLSPGISVDDPTHISLTLTYASDRQVNLHFTVSAGASNGTHSLWITTAILKSNAGTFTVAN